MAHQPFTVIIPAHNEESVIARCLEGIRSTAPPDHPMQIIVAANGCDDRTVEIAKRATPDADIVEIAKGSKTAAINAANTVAKHSPRIYLDADVGCDFNTLAALADVLRDGEVMVAAPAIRFDLSRASGAVRAYYRTWLRQPFAKEGKGGAGCYALSEAALASISFFPDIIADDAWVHSRFADGQRRVVSRDADGNPIATTVHPPRNFRELVRVEARKQIGNRQLRQKFPPLHPAPTAGGGGLRAAFQGGAELADLAAFVAVKMVARVVAFWRMARGQSRYWARDASSRQP